MTVTWMTLIAVGGSAIWLALALRSAFSRARFPKKGLRPQEKHLLAGSAVLALCWLAQIDYAALLRSSNTHTAQASAIATSTPKASCATLDVGMTAVEVKRRMGEPDEVRADEETRGPGASILVYRGSRCTVHLLDDRIEFVD